MSKVEVASAQIRQEILDIEQRRQQALLINDLDTLREIFDDSLIHVHAPGLTHNKEQLLEHVATRQAYLGMRRGDLTIRVAGDVAVMTGELVNTLVNPDGGERTIAGPVIQVLHRDGDQRWRFLSFQMTPYGEHVWKATDAEKEQIDSRKK